MGVNFYDYNEDKNLLGYDHAVRGIMMFDIYDDNRNPILDNEFSFDTSRHEPGYNCWLGNPSVDNVNGFKVHPQQQNFNFKWYGEYAGYGYRRMRFKVECTIRWNDRDVHGGQLIGKLGITTAGNTYYFGIPKPYTKPKKEFEITVDKHMNLGTTFAGGTLRTKDGGIPAEITIKSEKGNNFKLSIPKVVTIRNSHNQTLDVNLGFRGERYFPYKHEAGYAYTHFIIDGVCKTNENNYGKYKGSFTVRVEYTDER